MQSSQHNLTIMVLSIIMPTVYANIGIGLSQLDSLSHDTNITLDYETPSHTFETGVGIAFDTQSASQGALGNEHETYLTSYLGYVKPLYQHVQSAIGTRLTWHLTDETAEQDMQESKLDIGFYTGLKYALNQSATTLMTATYTATNQKLSVIFAKP